MLKLSKYTSLGIGYSGNVQVIIKRTLNKRLGEDFHLSHHDEFTFIFLKALLEILLVIIVVWHFPPRIVIMTSGGRTVPRKIAEAPGGTTLANNLT